MMKISHLADDAIRLRIVPFALKDSQEMALQLSGQLYHIVG